MYWSRLLRNKTLPPQVPRRARSAAPDPTPTQLVRDLMREGRVEEGGVGVGGQLGTAATDRCLDGPPGTGRSPACP
jgi:hypothetical protein